MPISQIGQIAVITKDLERATAFYKDVLGVKFLFAAGPKLAFFDCGGLRLMLGPAEKPEFDHPSSILYFRTPDIFAEHARLRAAGVRFEGPPHLIAPMPDHDLYMAFFRDSEDNFLALMAEMPKNPAA